MKNEKKSKIAPLGSKPDDVQRVRQCMDELGWTQTTLAKASGLSQGSLSNFLRGKQKLSSPNTERVFGALQAGYDALKTGKQQAQPFAGKFQKLMALSEGWADLMPPSDPKQYATWKERILQLKRDADRTELLEQRLAASEELLSYCHDAVKMYRQRLGLSPDPMAKEFVEEVKRFRQQEAEAEKQANKE